MFILWLKSQVINLYIPSKVHWENECLTEDYTVAQGLSFFFLLPLKWYCNSLIYYYKYSPMSSEKILPFGWSTASWVAGLHHRGMSKKRISHSALQTWNLTDGGSISYGEKAQELRQRNGGQQILNHCWRWRHYNNLTFAKVADSVFGLDLWKG